LTERFGRRIVDVRSASPAGGRVCCPGLSITDTSRQAPGRSRVIDGFGSAGHADALRDLNRLITDIHAHRDLTGTVQAIVDVVLTAVGFGVAVVSVIRPDNMLKTIAVAGNERARLQLLGKERPSSHYEHEFDVAEVWGSLRFVPQDRAPEAADQGWVPDVQVPVTADAWHRLDALFAPLRSSGGDLVGVLSVDLPENGLRPSRLQCDLLEALALQAGIAVNNALLTEKLSAGEEIFRRAFAGVATGLALVGVRGPEQGRFLRINPALCSIVGYSADELLTMTPFQLTHPDDSHPRGSLFAGLLAGEAETYQREERFLHRDGHLIWAIVTASIARSDDQTPLCGVLQVEDISQRKAELIMLHHQARHDELTKLPNRTLVFERLAQSQETARRSGGSGAVLFIDVDDFKLTNDLHGHQVGDQVLSMLASRLRAAIRADDLVGRFGGDEFVVIADQLNIPDAKQLATRITTAVSAPITNKGVAIPISVTIGVSPIRVDVEPLETIIWEADGAMYEQKRTRTTTRTHPPHSAAPAKPDQPPPKF